ncbi:MAG TPA: chain length determinant protein EpsF [Burkholderiaceae bacterium]|jgi:chain length determinant protein EpsF
MTIAQFLVVLRARWRIALLILTATVGLVAAASLTMTPQYSAVASVVLDVKSPDPIAGVVLPGMTVPGYMGTQLGVLQSERVALEALKIVNGDADKAMQQQWRAETDGRGDFDAWLAERTLRQLDVVPVRDSNVIMVTYRASDPAYAAAVANAFVKAYIATTLEMRVDPAKKFSSVFDGSAKNLRAELEQAQTRLSAYQQSKGMVVNDEKLDVENLRLAELSSQYVVLQGLANESSSRQSQSISNPERTPEAVGSVLLSNLTSELVRQEARLRELATTLGDNNPRVLETRASIAQTRARIESETQRVSGSLAINNSVNQTRLEQARTAIEEQRNKLLHMKSQRDEAAVLQRDVENAQRAYDAVLARATQSSVESQTTQTNVSVLKRAVAPGKASSPRLELNLAVALIIGVLLGGGAAIARESADRRLRVDADVTRSLRQPLLGVLPTRSRAWTDARSRRRLTLQAARAPTPLLSR